MGKINSRDKGARGERELAKALREYGYDAHRSAQHCGNTGDAPDVVSSMSLLHIECKRTETLRLYDALDQARRDAQVGKLPVVMHRKNDCDWVAIMRLSDFVEIYREAEASYALREVEGEK